jgi:hypothetical protein
MTGQAFQEKVFNHDVPVLEKREVDPFHSISLDRGGTLIITQADTPGLWIEGQEDRLNYVRTRVRDGQLIISPGAKASQGLSVYVNMPDIRSIHLSGEARCITRSTLSIDNLEIIGSGASRFKLNVITGEFSSRLSGATVLELKGSALSHIANASGAVKVHGLEFITNQTLVNASGVVLVEVHANYDLSVKVSGAGTVKYRGTPENIQEKTSGQAKIIQVA